MSAKATSKTRRARSGRSDHASGDDPRITRLERLVSILERSTLAELDYEDEDIAVGLKRHPSSAAASPPAAPARVSAADPARPATAPAGSPSEGGAQAAPAAADTKDLHFVRSPFVGTFYASPSPDALPFARIGERVRRGQTLCIVEAMKLMNEIESEVDGTLVRVLADNGHAVQYGDALFEIRLG